MNTPFLSVIMGCYNSAATIAQAINSILLQTFVNFEFIIIDDCSTDDTVKIIEKYSDPRIILIKNNINQGLGYSLNLGVQLSRGKYIARMDADDLAYKNRFAKQINFMEKHPDIVCMGCAAKKIGNISFKNKVLSGYIIPPVTYEKIKAWLILGTPLLHPSVIFNKQLLQSYNINYDPKFRRGQDYELWSRLIWIGKIVNSRKILMEYRYSPSQASIKNRKEQIANSKIMYSRMLDKLLGKTISAEDLSTHTLFACCSCLTGSEFEKVKTWLIKLIPYIQSSEDYSAKEVKKVLSVRWAVVCRESKSFFCSIKEFFSIKFYFTTNALIHILRF